MPQMSPMMWMYLFIYFMSLYLILMIVIHNFILYKIIKINNFFINLLEYKFKW